MKKVGLVLSGGAVRGVAHLGVLQALTEAGITIHQISGTSSGAIAGALFAQGFKPLELLDLVVKTRLLKYIRPHWGSGFFSLHPTGKLFEELIPHNSFENLKIPLVTTAVSLTDNQLVYFSEGELIPAIQASIAIPGIFKPVEIKNKLFVDGGLLNNFPTEPLQKDCDFIIGSSCNALPRFDSKNSLKKTVERATLIVINADIEQKKTLCDILIDPPGLGEFGLFEIKKAKEIYTRAYDYARKVLEDVEIV